MTHYILVNRSQLSKTWSPAYPFILQSIHSLLCQRRSGRMSSTGSGLALKIGRQLKHSMLVHLFVGHGSIVPDYICTEILPFGVIIYPSIKPHSEITLLYRYPLQRESQSITTRNRCQHSSPYLDWTVSKAWRFMA